MDLQSSLKKFRDDAVSDKLIARALDAAESRRFVDDTGREDTIGDIGISIDQAALIHNLVRELGAVTTVETGFGTGLSALVCVAAKHDFPLSQHISIDAFGLDEGRGLILESFLAENYSASFKRLKERSEFALPPLADALRGQVKLSLIDGSHLFEKALLDFVYFDEMCADDGCIILDDAGAPAMETIVSFVESNRSNYAVDQSVPNTAVLWKKPGGDTRSWCHFRPFKVPQRIDWQYG